MTPTLYVKTPPLGFRDVPTLRLDERGQAAAARHIIEGEFGRKEVQRDTNEFDRIWFERWT